MKKAVKKTELRSSLSISLLPSEIEAVKLAAQRAGENSVSAFVKKVLMKAINETGGNGGSQDARTPQKKASLPSGRKVA